MNNWKIRGKLILIAFAIMSLIFIHFISAKNLADPKWDIPDNRTIINPDDNTQIIHTQNVDFTIPITATHYWNPDGLDTYEVIVKNLSIKGYADKVIRLTWNDERYISDTIKINYTFINGILNQSGIKPYSVKQNSRLTFKNFKAEESADSNVSSGNWKDLTRIDLTKVSQTASHLSFTAIDDINISSCGTLATSNTYYSMNNSITNNGLTTACMIITASNITLDCKGFYISSDDNRAGISATGVNQANITIRNCNITMGLGAGGIGAYFSGIFMKNISIFNSTFNNQYEGIFINHASTLQKGIIEGNTLNNNSYGLDFLNQYTVGFTVSNNRISNSKLFGFYGGANNNIINNTFNSNNNTIYIGTSYGSNNQIINNTISNCLSANCVSLIGGNNLFQGGIINGSRYPAFWMPNVGSNTFDSVQLVNITSQIFYIYTYGGTQTVINMTYPISNETLASEGSSLIRKWYYGANTKSNSGPLSGTNITAYNATGTYNFNLTTNSSGWTPMTTIIDYYAVFVMGEEEAGVVRTYSSPYTIYATNSLYPVASHLFNASLGNNLNDTFTFIDYLYFENDNLIADLTGNVSISWNSSLNGAYFKVI